MRSRDPIVVGRVDPRADLEAVLEGGAKILAKGRSVVVFPQGTRSEAFDAARFNSIGAKLAARAGVSILPLAVKTDYWGNGRILHGFGPVHRDRHILVRFGAPIAVEGRARKAHAETIAFIEENLREWGAPLESGNARS